MLIYHTLRGIYIDDQELPRQKIDFVGWSWLYLIFSYNFYSKFYNKILVFQIRASSAFPLRYIAL